MSDIHTDDNPLQPRQNPGHSSDEVAVAAEELMARYRVLKEQGAHEAARKLLRAALDLMSEEDNIKATTSPTKQLSPETVKIIAMLKADWTEISEMVQETGMSVNRVHSTLARLRAKGDNLQSQTIKRYRLAVKD